jgi:alkylated DNA repair dioxygenase AlkB
VNWYADGKDHIGMHSDNPKQHVSDPQWGFAIYSLTLWEEIGIPRIFRIKPVNGGRDRLDLPLDNGLLVVMGGQMQEHFKHGVPATTKETGRRINITMRQFRE